MTFDSEKFIREIEMRNAIWDISCDEYSDRDAKRRRWEEITNIMCEENMTENEKNELGKSLQRKWKNIRTSFSRELKRRKGIKSRSAALRKGPYTYFEQLQFLMKIVTTNATENSLEEGDMSENNGDANIQTRPPITKKKKKTDDDDLVEVLKQSMAKREERERNQESDSDRLFILSLLDDFRKVPEHRRLSTKIELIETIKRGQMDPMESHHSSGAGLYSRISGQELSKNVQYRQEYSTQPLYRPVNSATGQYRHEHTVQSNYRPDESTIQQYRYEKQRNYVSQSTSRQATPREYDHLSPQSNGSDATQNSEIFDLFTQSQLQDIN